jgi:TPR repeat protein
MGPGIRLYHAGWQGVGVAPDSEKAAKWLRKAARGGRPEAAALLEALEKGVGQPPPFPSQRASRPLLSELPTLSCSPFSSPRRTEGRTDGV